MSTLNDLKNRAYICAIRVIEMELKKSQVKFEWIHGTYIKVARAELVVELFKKYENVFVVKKSTDTQVYISEFYIGSIRKLLDDIEVSHTATTSKGLKIQPRLREAIVHAKMKQVTDVFRRGNGRKIRSHWLYKGAVYNVEPYVDAGVVRGTRIEHASFRI